MTQKDEELERSTRRLGDRFGAAKSSAGDSQQADGEGDESNSDQSETSSGTETEPTSSSGSNPEAETDDASSTEEVPEWVPTTLYLPEETRRDLRRFLKRLTLDYPEIEDAQKRELHTALIQVAMDRPEAVADRTEELSDTDN
ncbi:hypothetical protein AUR64_02080 [Haloprofundus marisrubri]|uniref:DUF8160 domain-containing protein n=1 Tax=Haloprofundus marisrubri TaxID=1514971 RepID=A0A0W1R3V7_9EURY|nr:hypothetical protein [Haloprofundus marisrubri]KTG07841.1 hypothetical protein AUR64_02080 [Haloprofundus marisrubri]